MEQDLLKLKKNIRISSIIVILTCASMAISPQIKIIRAVDFLQIFAAGVAFGALLVNLMTFRNKRKQY